MFSGDPVVVGVNRPDRLGASTTIGFGFHIAGTTNEPAAPLTGVRLGLPPGYYTHAHGTTVAFHPQGVSVPLRCPRGGFPFSASFTFLDGTSAEAKSTVPCPPLELRSKRGSNRGKI